MKPLTLVLSSVAGLFGVLSSGLSQAQTNSTKASQPIAAISSTASMSTFGQHIKAKLIDGNGDSAGEASAWQGTEGVLLQIRAEGLPSGWHGTHLHRTGTCSDIGKFTASGGHVEGKGGPHGFLNADGTHAGDLPNIYVHDDGTANVDFFTSAITFDDLLDPDGSALVIHAARDDYQTQPIGGAGVRISCAAFSTM